MVKEANDRALLSLEIVEINSQSALVRNVTVVDAFFGDDKVCPRGGGRGFQDFHFLAAVDGPTPKAAQITTLRVINEFAARAGFRRHTTTPPNLNSSPPLPRTF